MKLRPYSEAKSLPLKWKKSAKHFLKFTGSTTTDNPGLYLGELEESGTVKEGKRADLVLQEGNPLKKSPTPGR